MMGEQQCQKMMIYVAFVVFSEHKTMDPVSRNRRPVRDALYAFQ